MQRMKDLLLRAPVVVRTSNMKISRRRLADYVKTLHQKACRTCSTIIFLHSTNEIIDLWRCRWRCRRQILNSLILEWGDETGPAEDQTDDYWLSRLIYMGRLLQLEDLLVRLTSWQHNVLLRIFPALFYFKRYVTLCFSSSPHYCVTNLACCSFFSLI